MFRTESVDVMVSKNLFGLIFSIKLFNFGLQLSTKLIDSKFFVSKKYLAPPFTKQSKNQLKMVPKINIFNFPFKRFKLSLQ